MDIQKIKKKIVKNLKEDIPGLSEDIEKFSLDPLISKKNLVYNLSFYRKPRNFPKELIIKIFQTKNAEIEYKTYKRLENQNLDIPQVYLYKKPYLLLEKINGINLCDFINDNLVSVTKLKELDSDIRDNIIKSIEMLANWFAQLHIKNKLSRKKGLEIIVLNKGDPRLKDFIIDFSKDRIYGLDFEDSYEANHIDDLAWICTALLDTNPGIFEMVDPKHKIELINIFLKKYYSITSFNFDYPYFAAHLIDDLNIVMKRRSIKISPIKKTNFIEEIEKEL
jgi:hypothetical protein